FHPGGRRLVKVAAGPQPSGTGGTWPEFGDELLVSGLRAIPRPQQELQRAADRFENTIASDRRCRIRYGRRPIRLRQLLFAARRSRLGWPNDTAGRRHSVRWRRFGGRSHQFWPVA